MALVLYADREKAEKLREILLKDDLVSRANVILKDAKMMDKEGFYIRILGDEKQCERALELSKGLAEEVTGEEKEKILNLMKKEDEEMLSGFSGIFR
ncbi:MAG: hypothetical protein N3F65_02100 [Nitrososphaeria archaeon]|nr:hypothetical protein [Nitrososphaeria archaeon]MDW8021794.1 hypothetical protein [Nitrososphaerota archaeon]